MDRVFRSDTQSGQSAGSRLACQPWASPHRPAAA